MLFPLWERRELCRFPHVLKATCVMLCFFVFSVFIFHNVFLSVGLLMLLKKIVTALKTSIIYIYKGLLSLQAREESLWGIRCFGSGTISCVLVGVVPEESSLMSVQEHH